MIKTILIAEDEKLIRKGLAAMVKRAPVTVERVLEASSGKEALEMIDSEQVDMIITDICMPQMDGMKFTGELKKRGCNVPVIAVSGYDDFNYAVSMLQNGVRDYLLKPVEREKLYSVIAEIDRELEEKKNAAVQSSKEKQLMLKHFMLGQSMTSEERENYIRANSVEFVSDNYVCMVYYSETLPEKIASSVMIDEYSSAAIISESSDIFSQVTDIPVGISSIFSGIEKLPAAYKEAEAAYKRAYFSGRTVTFGETSAIQSKLPDSEGILQQILLGRKDEAVRLMRSAAEIAADGRCDASQVHKLFRETAEGIIKAFSDTIGSGSELDIFLYPRRFSSVEKYMSEFDSWLDNFCHTSVQELINNDNKQKIRKAVLYIQENYASPINMAMVSNYVSMNYSLFSLLFKQYTGTNFVNYLHKIRIEQAKKLLEDTDRKVYEIAHKVGFSDEKHFLKVFKSQCGISPGEYRIIASRKQ